MAMVSMLLVAIANVWALPIMKLRGAVGLVLEHVGEERPLSFVVRAPHLVPYNREIFFPIKHQGLFELVGFSAHWPMNTPQWFESSCS